MLIAHSKIKRNYSLDAIKGIAAILVVFQHSAGSGYFAEYLLVISRVAVPFFMVVSGFLYKDVTENHGERKQIRKFLHIAVEMTAFYFVIDFFYNALRGRTITYLISIFNPKELLAFLLFNDPTVADHAWYMWAMIYTLILVKMVPNIYKNKRIALLLILVSTGLQLVFGKYSVLFFNYDISSRFTRNVWTVGSPYFLIGILLRDYSDQELKKPVSFYSWLAVLFGVLCLLERRMLVSFEVNGTRDSYVFLLPFVVALFMALYTSNRLKVEGILSELGRKYSLVLYIVHPLFVRVEYKLLDMESMQQYLGFICVFAISLFVSWFIVKAIEKTPRDCFIRKILVW